MNARHGEISKTMTRETLLRVKFSALSLAAQAGIHVPEHRLGRSADTVSRSLPDLSRAQEPYPLHFRVEPAGLAQGDQTAYTLPGRCIRQFGNDVPATSASCGGGLVFSLLASTTTTIFAITASSCTNLDAGRSRRPTISTPCRKWTALARAKPHHEDQEEPTIAGALAAAPPLRSQGN